MIELRMSMALTVGDDRNIKITNGKRVCKFWKRKKSNYSMHPRKGYLHLFLRLHFGSPFSWLQKVFDVHPQNEEVKARDRFLKKSSETVSYSRCIFVVHSFDVYQAANSF